LALAAISDFPKNCSFFTFGACSQGWPKSVKKNLGWFLGGFIFFGFYWVLLILALPITGFYWVFSLLNIE